MLAEETAAHDTILTLVLMYNTQTRLPSDEIPYRELKASGWLQTAGHRDSQHLGSQLGGRGLDDAFSRIGVPTAGARRH